MLLLKLTGVNTIFKVGQNHTCAPYMTVCMVNFLLKMPYIHRIYIRTYGSSQPYLYHTYVHERIHKGTNTHTNTLLCKRDIIEMAACHTGTLYTDHNQHP